MRFVKSVGTTSNNQHNTTPKVSPVITKPKICITEKGWDYDEGGDDQGDVEYDGGEVPDDREVCGEGYSVPGETMYGGVASRTTANEVRKVYCVTGREGRNVTVYLVPGVDVHVPIVPIKNHWLSPKNSW